MGTVCGKNSPVTEDTAPREKKFQTPAQITSISGIDVDRSDPLYQYALFCSTRLMDKYKEFLFPHVTMSLGSFREDLRDYLDVIEQVYHDLDFDERMLANARVSLTADTAAKNSVSLLAFSYMRTSSKQEDNNTEIRAKQESEIEEQGDDDTEQKIADPQIAAIDLTELDTEYAQCKLTLQEDERYKYIYEDTLKLLTTDLERKEIWQPSTLDSNEMFRDYLRTKEPDTYKDLEDETVTIVVPKPLGRKTQTGDSSEEEEPLMRNNGLV